jgi:hypothetical protein
MKTQTPHVVAPGLDEFFKLPLTFTGETVTTANCRHSNTAQYSPEVGAISINDVHALRLPPHSLRSWAVLRAFVTLVLTIRRRSAQADQHQEQSSRLPKGAVLVARYLSR